MNYMEYYLNSNLKYNCIKKEERTKILLMEKPYEVQEHINELYVLISYLMQNKPRIDNELD